MFGIEPKATSSEILFHLIEPFIFELEDPDAAHAALAAIVATLENLRDTDDAQILYPRGDELEVAYSTKFDNIGFSVPVSDSISGLAFSRVASVVIDDVRGQSSFGSLYKSFLGDKIRSEIAVPVKLHKSIVAIINVESPVPGAFDDSFRRTMEDFAARASIPLLLISLRKTAIEEIELRSANDVLNTLAADAGNMVHTLRNTISPIDLLLTQIVEECSPHVEQNRILRRNLQGIAEAVEEASELIERVHLRTIESDLLDVNKEIRLFVSQMKVSSRVRTELNLCDDLPLVRCSSFNVILDNLIQNAVLAMPGGGTIAITTRNISYENVSQGYAEIVVQDTGHGMDEETRKKAFGRGFSTRDGRSDGLGSGLGLWWVKLVISKAKGTIELRSKVGDGTRARMRFPYA